jgi:hypothetical protein
LGKNYAKKCLWSELQKMSELSSPPITLAVLNQTYTHTLMLFLRGSGFSIANEVALPWFYCHFRDCIQSRKNAFQARPPRPHSCKRQRELLTPKSKNPPSERNIDHYAVTRYSRIPSSSRVCILYFTCCSYFNARTNYRTWLLSHKNTLISVYSTRT